MSRAVTRLLIAVTSLPCRCGPHLGSFRPLAASTQASRPQGRARHRPSRPSAGDKFGKFAVGLSHQDPALQHRRRQLHAILPGMLCAEAERHPKHNARHCRMRFVQTCCELGWFLVVRNVVNSQAGSITYS